MLLISLGIGVGIGSAFALVAGLYVWYQRRPPKNTWDSDAVTASFLSADTTGDGNHLRFRYILENHTDQDYRVNSDDLYLSAILKDQHSLTGPGQGDIKIQYAISDSDKYPRRVR